MQPNIHRVSVGRLCRVAICSIVICIVGCSRRTDLQARIDFQLSYDKEHPRSRKNKTQQTLADEIQAALKTITPDSLGSPGIASAVIGKEKRDAYTLILFWTEEQPSVEGIKIRLGNSQELNVAIPDNYIKENREDASRTILYRAFFGFEPGSPEWAKVDNAIAAGKPLELTLIRAGKPVGKPRTVLVTQ